MWQIGRNKIYLVLTTSTQELVLGFFFTKTGSVMFYVKITLMCNRESMLPLMNEIKKGQFLKKKNNKAGSVDPKTLKYGTNN